MKDFGFQARINLASVSNDWNVSAVLYTGLSPYIGTPAFNHDGPLYKKDKPT